MAETGGRGTGVRLRAGTRSRDLDGRGVAVSAGASAVVVDGVGARALWSTIEPALRTGVEPDVLLASVPDDGREVVAGILAQLDRHHLLREVEPAADDVPALAHLEAVARRPAAAARLVATTTLRVTGTGPVAATAAAHLLAAGYPEVVTRAEEPPRAPATPRTGSARLLARVERLGPDDAWHPVAFAAGDERTVLVGPRDRDADALGEAAALARVGRADADDGPPAPQTLLGTLVGAQLALAVLGSSARAADGTTPPRWPSYLVTSGGLVSEPRTHVVLPRLGADGRVLDVDAWADTAAGGSDVLALERLEPVWDPVLGAVGEPLPLDLPQLPVGLAALVDDEGRTLGGIGTTTAAARLDAVLGALRVVAAGPTGHPGGSLGLGTTPAAARADAVARLVERSDVGWRPAPVDRGALGPGSRRLAAALTRQLGVPALVTLAVAGTGLRRADVRDRDGALLGRAVATTTGPAVHEALLRAVGLVQWQSSHASLVAPDPVLDVLGTRTPAVLAEVDGWACAAVASGALQVVEPRHADGWGTVGVQAAVASWT